jgi:hypothetical protein
MIKVGQVVECRTYGKLERFKVTKVGRKYVYLFSDQSGQWRAEKVVLENPHLFGPPDVTRCN